MEINLIVAVDEKNGIGKDGKLPWHIPEDLRRVKSLTFLCPVITGRKTFKSLGNKLLENRYYAVVSSSEFTGFKSVTNAVRGIEQFIGYKVAWIIGGAGIYKEALDNNLVDKLYITRVKGDYDCDVFLPEIDYSRWQLIESNDIGVCVYDVYEKATR